MRRQRSARSVIEKLRQDREIRSATELRRRRRQLVEIPTDGGAALCKVEAQGFRQR